MILQTALWIAFGCFGLAILLNLWVILNASLVQDRILALDTLVVNAIAVVVLYGVATLSAVNFEAAMLMAMTGFISTVAFAKYLLRGDIIE
jgi:multicomponent K+:H+ antiporter subunit F